MAKKEIPADKILGSIEMLYINHIRACLFAAGEMIRTPIASLMTLLVIGIALALPSALYLLLENSQNLTQHWDGTPHISLYLKTDTAEPEINQTLQQLRSQTQIGEIKYISPEEGLHDFETTTGMTGILSNLKKNPLPGVIVISPSSDYQAPEAVAALFQSLKSLTNVESAQLDMLWVKRLYYIMQIGKRITYGLAALFGLGVIMIIGNTIRLATQSNEQEIAILRLIGATPGFIRRPLLYRGAFYGLFGGIIASLIVALLMWWLAEPLDNLAQSYGTNFALQGFSLRSALSIFASSILLGITGS